MKEERGTETETVLRFRKTREGESEKNKLFEKRVSKRERKFSEKKREGESEKEDTNKPFHFFATDFYNIS